MDHEKITFFCYVANVIQEMKNRGIKFNEKYYDEIYEFCQPSINQMFPYNYSYSEHNERYLTQCYYNLQEKYDRGIITTEEFTKIAEVYLK